MSVQNHTAWPAIQYGPFQQVFFSNDSRIWEVYGVEFDRFRDSQCRYFVAIEDPWEIRVADFSKLCAVGDTQVEGINALEQWNIKLELGQIVRRSTVEGDPGPLWTVEGLLFRYLGRRICRKYYLRKYYPDRPLYLEHENLLQQSNLHL